MSWKTILKKILQSSELCLPFCIFILTTLNPLSTAIILFQFALLRIYRKRVPKLTLSREERIELAKLASVIPNLLVKTIDTRI